MAKKKKKTKRTKKNARAGNGKIMKALLAFVEKAPRSTTRLDNVVRGMARRGITVTGRQLIPLIAKERTLEKNGNVVRLVKAAGRGTNSDGQGKARLRDLVLEIVGQAKKKIMHVDTLMAALAERGYVARMQNIGRSIFSEPKLIRDGEFVRFSSGPERASRITQVELALSNQGEAIRRGAEERRGAAKGEGGSSVFQKRVYQITKPNTIAAIQVLDTVLDSEDLPPVARQKLLLTVRRLLGGKDEE